MMKQLIKYLILIFATLTLTNACKKQKIPTGDHTFSCYINGKLFLPKGGYDDIYGSYSGLSISINENYLFVLADNSGDYFFLNITEPDKTRYSLVHSNGLIPPERDSKVINHAVVRIDGVVYISHSNSGWVEITKLDTISNTIDVKGKFEFTLYNQNNPNDKLVITKGQFDN